MGQVLKTFLIDETMVGRVWVAANDVLGRKITSQEYPGRLNPILWGDFPTAGLQSFSVPLVGSRRAPSSFEQELNNHLESIVLVIPWLVTGRASHCLGRWPPRHRPTN